MGVSGLDAVSPFRHPRGGSTHGTRLRAGEADRRRCAHGPRLLRLVLSDPPSLGQQLGSGLRLTSPSWEQDTSPSIYNHGRAAERHSATSESEPDQRHGRWLSSWPRKVDEVSSLMALSRSDPGPSVTSRSMRDRLVGSRAAGCAHANKKKSSRSRLDHHVRNTQATMPAEDTRTRRQHVFHVMLGLVQGRHDLSTDDARLQPPYQCVRIPAFGRRGADERLSTLLSPFTRSLSSMKI